MQAGRAHVLVLVVPKQDEEGAGEAPDGEQEQEKEEADVDDHRLERVQERVLGRLHGPARSCARSQRLHTPCSVCVRTSAILPNVSYLDILLCSGNSLCSCLYLQHDCSTGHTEGSTPPPAPASLAALQRHAGAVWVRAWRSTARGPTAAAPGRPPARTACCWPGAGGPGASPQ